MGIDARAVVFVGLPRAEIETEELQGLIDSGELDVAPPHYDGYSEDDAICGLQVAASGNYAAIELTWNQANCDALMAQFKALTGQDAKVWLSPYVY